ncbi:MAG: PLDc N-terminal domain-containing protein [Dongiaceae bacterium]
MSVEVHGLIGLLLLVAAIWAIVNVVGSGASTGGKVLWILLILLFPLIGFLIWLFAGPRSAPRSP